MSVFRYLKINQGIKKSPINFTGLFFSFDEGQLVVLFNGFQKKYQKTPQKEINKAEQLMKDSFNNKKYEDIKTFDELIELEHGKIGTERRINTKNVHKC